MPNPYHGGCTAYTRGKLASGIPQIRHICLVLNSGGDNATVRTAEDRLTCGCILPHIPANKRHQRQRYSQPCLTLYLGLAIKISAMGRGCIIVCEVWRHVSISKRFSFRYVRMGTSTTIRFCLSEQDVALSREKRPGNIHTESPGPENSMHIALRVPRIYSRSRGGMGGMAKDMG